MTKMKKTMTDKHHQVHKLKKETEIIKATLFFLPNVQNAALIFFNSSFTRSIASSIIF